MNGGKQCTSHLAQHMNLFNRRALSRNMLSFECSERGEDMDVSGLNLRKEERTCSTRPCVFEPRNAYPSNNEDATTESLVDLYVPKHPVVSQPCRSSAQDFENSPRTWTAPFLDNARRRERHMSACNNRFRWKNLKGKLDGRNTWSDQDVVFGKCSM